MPSTNRVIRIYGVGDSRERALLRALNQAAKELSMEVDVEMVCDLLTFLQEGIGGIPALAIGGRIVSTGRVPEVAELKSHLAA